MQTFPNPFPLFRLSPVLLLSLFPLLFPRPVLFPLLSRFSLSLSLCSRFSHYSSRYNLPLPSLLFSASLCSLFCYSFCLLFPLFLCSLNPCSVCPSFVLSSPLRVLARCISNFQRPLVRWSFISWWNAEFLDRCHRSSWELNFEITDSLE